MRDPSVKREIPVITIDDDDDEDPSPSVIRETKEPNLNVMPNFNPGVNGRDVQFYRAVFVPPTGAPVSSALPTESRPNGFSNGVESAAQGKIVANDEPGCSNSPPDPAPSIKPFNYQIIRLPNFELQGDKDLLVIFNPEDRNQCYDFRYRTKNIYLCVKCKQKHKRNIVAKLLEDKNGKQYVELRNQHLCEPTSYPYRPDKRIIQEPHFEIQTKENGILKLVIFVPTNPNLCYYYSNTRLNFFECCGCRRGDQGRSVTAKLFKDDSGKEYLKANMNHLCEPQKYSSAPPNPSSNWKFVKASGFEIQDRNGSDPVLIIFVGNDRNSCYKMNYSKSSASYICNQCRIQHQKRVSARVLKYPNGEEYIRMKHDHVCEPISYPPAPEVQIIHQPFYEVRNANQPNPKLIVYIGNDRKLYYKLYYETSTGNFVCSRCKTGHNKRTIAKLLRSLNDEEYVRMKLHDCTPFEL